MVLGQYGYGAAVQAVEAAQRNSTNTTPPVTSPTTTSTTTNTELEKYLPACLSSPPPPPYLSTATTMDLPHQPHTLISGVTGRVHLVQLHEAAYTPPEYRIAIASLVGPVVIVKDGDEADSTHDTYGTFHAADDDDAEQPTQKQHAVLIVRGDDGRGGCKRTLEILIENIWWVIGMIGFVVVCVYYYGFLKG